MEEPQEVELEWTVPTHATSTGRRNRRLLAFIMVVGIMMFAAGFAVRSAMTLDPKVTASSSSPSIIARTTSNLSTAKVTSPGLPVVIDIHGDVHRPGVYHLARSSRVQDAVKAAGGFVHPQDAAIVNLAAPVDDGQEIVVPNAVLLQSDNSAGSGDASGVFSQSAGVAAVDSTSLPSHAAINLNTANLASLETLPGIGPGRAQSIVDYRRQHGLFHSVKDIQQVRGIGAEIFARIKPYLVVTAK